MVHLISPPKQKWVDGRITNETYETEAFINPKYVISVEWNHPFDKKYSIVTIKHAMVKDYADKRSPDIVAQLIETDLKNHL